MNNNQVFVVTFICLVAKINSQLVSPLQCDPLVVGISEFNTTKFMGNWFEVYRYGEESFGTKANCVKTSLSIHEDNAEPLRMETTFKVLPDKKQSLTYYGTGSNLTAGADFNMTMAFNGTIWNFDYRVMSTDYSSYAIAYSCQNLNTTHKAEYAWVLLRETTLIPDIKSNVTLIAEAGNYLNLTELTLVEQSEALCGGSSRFLPPVLLILVVMLVNLIN